MGNLKSKQVDEPNFYIGASGSDLAGAGLTYDKQTKVIYTGGESVIIGTRQKLNLMTGATKPHLDMFKSLGIVVKTRGTPFSRNITLVVADFYRVQGDKLMQRNKQQGSAPSSWYGEKGPAERSGSLRIGDLLYTINGVLVLNKSKGHIQRMLIQMIEKRAFPLVLTWRHDTNVNQIAWEVEDCFPPPEGEFYQQDDEFGTAQDQKHPSVSI